MFAAKNDWEIANTQVFWEEIATHDHLVQIYDDEEVFINLLSGYVISGILAGDSVVVIATGAHLMTLEERLKTHGFNMFALTWRNQYIPLNAEQTLHRFMVNGWPNENLFMKLVSDLMRRARGDKGRNVRAFGEMVAILLDRNQYGATIALEGLWNKFAQTEKFCLFCAYPKSAFKQNPNAAMHQICGAHAKVISPIGDSTSHIQYTKTKRAKELS